MKAIFCNTGFLLSMAFFFLTTAGAQTQLKKDPVTWSAVVRDSTGVALQAASVEVVNAVPRRNLYVMITDSMGRFTLPIPDTTPFMIRISSAGYATWQSEILNTAAPSPGLTRLLSLPAIILQRAGSNTLGSVTVTGKKPLLEQQIDRVVVNVDAMIGAPGNNALEILEKTPGVVVDMSGGIGLNGKTSVMILIDGRPTQMGAQDLAAYLRSLPGGTLDKIELIDNPPARYEAAGNAIINIRLKRNKLKGFTGSFSGGYNQGAYARNNSSLLLNYNRKKISLSASLGYSHDAGYSKNDGTRIYSTPDGSVLASLISNNTALNTGDAFNGRFVSDYAVTERTSIGLIYNLNLRRSQEDQWYRNEQYNETGSADSVASGITGINNRWNSAGYNLNFLHKYKQPGREVAGDFNYSRYLSDGHQSLFNSIEKAGQAINTGDRFSYGSPSQMDIYSAQVDYIHPMKNKLRLDAGAKASYVINDNEFSLEGELPAAAQPGSDRSNHFIYRESIIAGYVNGRKEWKRFSTQVGVRFEHTRSEGDQAGNGSVSGSKFHRGYTNLFPSFFASYKLDSNNINFLDLSYGRRIRRPNYQSLNPFLYFVDQYSYSSGNPGLRPQFANMFELKYRYKRFLSVGFQYGDYSNVIFSIAQPVDKILVSRPDNVADGSIITLSVNLNMPVAGWWTFNFNGQAYRLRLKGISNSQRVDQEAMSLRGSMTNQFVIAKGLTAELNAFVNGRDISGQRAIDPKFRLNEGLQKRILKDKGSLRLVVEDIFFTNRQADETRGIAGLMAFNTSWSDSRRVGLGFTWNFGKDQNKKRNMNENSAQEEKSRVD